MTLREFTQVLISVLALTMPGVALAQATQSSIGSNIPVLASGVSPSAIPAGEEGPSNAFRGSLTLASNYDDNALPTVTPREWDVHYSILPEISFNVIRPRLEWNVDYSPGVNLSQRGFYRNVFAQKFKGNFLWLVTPHGTLSVEQSYVVTTDPFGGGAGTGPVLAPNESIFVANSKQTWLMSHALYSYQHSAQTTMGVGGSYSLQNYDSVPKSGPTTPLVHAQVASGQAYISHQFSPRNQLGFQYSGQVMKFQADARTTTHSFTVFDQINFSPHSTLSLYGGPQYSLIANQIALNLGFVVISIPVNAKQWNGSGGVMYNWTGDRLATVINFSRGVSDGGALIGAVELTEGDAEFTVRMTRNLDLTMTIRGADDQILAGGTSNGELRNYSGRLGLQRRLGRDFNATVYYERLNQSGSINGFSAGNHDIVGASLQYTFLRPIGR